MACDQVIDSYDGSNDSADILEDVGDYVGQAFAMGEIAREICMAKFYIEVAQLGDGLIDVAAKIYACTGTPGTDGEPTGVALATSDGIQYGEYHAPAWVEFTFSTPYTLLAGTNYCIVLENIVVTGAGLFISVHFDNTSPTHGGNYCYNIGGTSSYNAGYDCNFIIYSEGPDIEYSITVMQDEAQHTITTSSEPQHNINTTSESQHNIITSYESQYIIEIITDEE